MFFKGNRGEGKEDEEENRMGEKYEKDRGVWGETHQARRKFLCSISSRQRFCQRRNILLGHRIVSTHYPLYLL